jgi:hypothetical protein
MPEENDNKDVNVVAVNNNQSWIEWVGALLLRFVYATIKFVPF